MVQTKVFKSNQSQAVRLPKAVAFPKHVSEVSIAVIGKTRVISPVAQSWDSWFDSPAAGLDFMEDRVQPEHQQRESFDG